MRSKHLNQLVYFYFALSDKNEEPNQHEEKNMYSNEKDKRREDYNRDDDPHQREIKKKYPTTMWNIEWNL